MYACVYSGYRLDTYNICRFHGILVHFSVFSGHYSLAGLHLDKLPFSDWTLSFEKLILPALIYLFYFVSAAAGGEVFWLQLAVCLINIFIYLPAFKWICLHCFQIFKESETIEHRSRSPLEFMAHFGLNEHFRDWV